MLNINFEDNTFLYEDYKKITGYERMLSITASIPISNRNVSDYLKEITNSALNEKFPGSILPYLVEINGTKTINYFAVAPTIEKWRELSPLIYAYAGQTLSDFQKFTSNFEDGSENETWIREHFPFAARIQPGKSKEKRILLIQALSSLQKNISRAKRSKFSFQEPISELIKEFELALNNLDKKEVERILNLLDTGSRLEGVNLRFLEIRFYSAFGEWDKIIESSFLRDICQIKRPTNITRTIINAFFYYHFSHFEEDSDIQSFLDIFNNKIRTVSGNIFNFLPVKPSETDLVTFAFSLFSDEEENRKLFKELKQELKPEIYPKLVKVWNLLVQKTGKYQVQPFQDALPPEEIKLSEQDLIGELLLRLKTEDSLVLYNQLLENLKELPDNFKSIINPTLSEISSEGIRVPSNWIEWAELLYDEDFSNFKEIADKARDDWPIKSNFNDPVKVVKLVEIIENMSEGSIAKMRLNDALSYLITWLENDEEFPNPSFVKLYNCILTIYIDIPNISDNMLKSSQKLISAMFNLGLNNSSYADLIDILQILISRANGYKHLAWISDILEQSIESSCPDMNLRKDLFHSALKNMRSYASKLTLIEKKILTGIFLILDISDPIFEITPEQEQEENIDSSPLKKLEGLKIGIYSLTESAVRRAKEILESLVPSITVYLNHDHGLTRQLESMANNCDIFVMVTSSAKHAATIPIQNIRRTNNKPLIFPIGKGFSSIISELINYCNKPNG